ncbi:M16 family metallopeptidase [Bombilactobacillus thymidiniphilus]|uniref:Insulinase family protein n=1 Tax=Bombilactobacillus thymidiniphilus TaxID=2923363 RepID=A0ABY4PC80_9LACO|nr:insulinase family protein [Bombilactobacillus thymidiniphilus]UQS83297.1 insulinase family protein [Bombilactobacillus thymidiniphilus]
MTKIINYNLAPGIEVIWLPSNKFSALKWKFNFIAPQIGSKTTARRLLADLLQRSNQKYSSEARLAQRLAFLYGTDLSAQTTILQNLNILSLAVTVPQVPHKDVNNQALTLLWQTLQHPNLVPTHDQFQEQAFQLEQYNLANLYESLTDNYALRASLAMHKMLYQNNPELVVPDFGCAKQLSTLNAGRLYHEYQQLLTTNRVIISIVGDPRQEIVPQRLEQLDFLASNYDLLKLESKNLVELPTNFIKKQTIEPLQQTQLVVAYKMTQNVSKAISHVLNMLLGGDDQALLFQQVREQAGLAYSIYSEVNVRQQFIIIQAGITAKDIVQVEDLIDQQIKNLTQKVDEQSLAHAKLAIINRRLVGSDSLNQQGERLLMKALDPKIILDDQYFIEQIQAVTVRQVKQAAADLVKVAEYDLIGSVENG